MLRAPKICGVLVCTVCLHGCGAQAHERKSAEAPSPGAAPSTALPPSPGTSVATRETPADDHACVMLYECGCNASCTDIDLATSALGDGVETAE